tara:strand:+ start:420 stop:587 length:168 start_codon:yes stop_codon:yes gene_type:complete
MMNESVLNAIALFACMSSLFASLALLSKERYLQNLTHLVKNKCGQIFMKMDFNKE